MRRYYIARRERPLAGLIWCVWTLRDGEKRPDFRRAPNAMSTDLSHLLEIVRNRMQKLEILEKNRRQDAALRKRARRWRDEARYGF